MMVDAKLLGSFRRALPPARGPRRRAAFWLAGLLAAGACGNGGQTEPPDDDAIRACILDVWFSPGASDCACPENATAPECDQPDCERHTFYVFLQEEVVSGFAWVSREAASVSTDGAVDRRPYVIDDGALRIGHGDRTSSVQCGDDRLVVSGVIYDRGPSGLHEAVEMVMDKSGAFFGVEW